MLLVCALFLAFALPTHGSTTWPCYFASPDGYFYNFTSVNTNSSDSQGLSLDFCDCNSLMIGLQTVVPDRQQTSELVLLETMRSHNGLLLICFHFLSIHTDSHTRTLPLTTSLAPPAHKSASSQGRRQTRA